MTLFMTVEISHYNRPRGNGTTVRQVNLLASFDQRYYANYSKILGVKNVDFKSNSVKVELVRKCQKNLISGLMKKR